MEETGLGADTEAWHLEQLASYGAPDRDPRMRVVTIAYLALCADLPAPRHGGDAAAAILTPVAEIERGAVRLAFDHERIVKDAVERTRSKLEYTALAAKLCPPAFTIGQLRRVYEVVWGERLYPGNFHRDFRASGAFEPRGGSEPAPGSQRGRPAALWSVRHSTDSDPFATSGAACCPTIETGRAGSWMVRKAGRSIARRRPCRRDGPRSRGGTLPRAERSPRAILRPADTEAR